MRAALAFLTTLPIPADDLESGDFAQASQWFGVVGLILGVLLGLAALLLHPLWSNEVCAALLLLLWVGLTGALHLDGLIDCGDALLASVPVARRLTILKDVHVGAFGVVVAVLLCLLKWATLTTLLRQPAAPLALLLPPIVGRSAIVMAQQRWPYARTEGVGRLFPANPAAWQGALGLLLLVAMLVAMRDGGQRLLAAGTALGATLLVAGWMSRRLGGGLTGDCYGALCEIGETLALLTLTIGTTS